jgi:glycosyltransferase involved in cell wall biosynthesis
VEYLLLTPDLFSTDGGISRMLRLYLKALCEISGESDEVRLLSLNDHLLDSTDLRRYTSGRLAEWEVCSRNKVKFCEAALRLGMRSNRIVCGHVAQLPLAWAACRFSRRKAYFLVAHGIEVWRPFSVLERRALLGADLILCVSEFTRRQLLDHCPVPPERTAVLHNALDPFMEPQAPAPAAGGPPVILVVSRLSATESYKGIDHLIEAMPAVRAAVPDARLRIVGRGDALPSLQELARRRNLGEAVSFAGYVSDSELHGEFARCRMFALPSQKEGFGLVYLEAMANGRPCLGARSGGTPEVITPEAGVLVEFGDVPGIAAAIVAALGRPWPVGPLLERSREFSYLRFKERLGSLISQ